MRLFVVCPLFLLVVATAGNAAEPFTITLRKEADRVSVAEADGMVAFTVESKMGIGGATIEPKAGQWPKRVVLRLRLNGLESLTVSNGKKNWSLSAGADGHAPRIYWKERGDETPIDKGDAFWSDIKVSKTPTVFEVPLPAGLFDDKPKSLKVDWIDFYR